jgi:hypothetical protein
MGRHGHTAVAVPVLCCAAVGPLGLVLLEPTSETEYVALPPAPQRRSVTRLFGNSARLVFKNKLAKYIAAGRRGAGRAVASITRTPGQSKCDSVVEQGAHSVRPGQQSLASFCTSVETC